MKGQSKVIYICGGRIENWTGQNVGNCGVDITYIKSRKILSIGGWYDGYVGIQNVEITFEKFCELLGIEVK